MEQLISMGSEFQDDKVKYHLTEEQLLRFMEMTAWEATGVVWGTRIIAEDVLRHYGAENSSTKEYIDCKTDDVPETSS